MYTSRADFVKSVPPQRQISLRVHVVVITSAVKVASIQRFGCTEWVRVEKEGSGRLRA